MRAHTIISKAVGTCTAGQVWTHSTARLKKVERGLALCGGDATPAAVEAAVLAELSIISGVDFQAPEVLTRGAHELEDLREMVGGFWDDEEA